MTRIKAHNPAKQVTGGDSSRSLPAGGGGGGSGQLAQILSSKFTTGDVSVQKFHDVTVKTKVGYVYIMEFGGTFHASHDTSLGYYKFNVDGAERAKYKVAGGNGYAQGGSYKYFTDGTGNDMNFAFVHDWDSGVIWEFVWCTLTEIYRKP